MEVEWFAQEVMKYFHLGEITMGLLLIEHFIKAELCSDCIEELKLLLKDFVADLLDNGIVECEDIKKLLGKGKWEGEMEKFVNELRGICELN